MNIFERIASRFGFVRSAGTELIVFPSYEAAREAGFSGARHPNLPNVAAWWPGQGPSGLRSRPIQRVTIPRSMTRLRTSEGALVPLLRSRQVSWGRNAVWVEL